MPTYEYHCDACEHNFDEFQSFSDKQLKKCPKCGKRFWIERRLIKTSRMDGNLKGFNCPEERCEGVAEWNPLSKKEV